MSSSAAMDKDLTQQFIGEKQTECYVKFRPTYPSHVQEAIIKFYREKLNDFDLAVDVGCGPGESTVILAPHFKQVVGLDASEQQLSHAPRDVANVSFHVSLAEDLSRFQPGTVDLVTVAEAFHWFKHETFFSEVTRVLKPGGSLVVYGYTLPVLSLPELDAVLQQSSETIGAQWPPEFSEVYSKYKNYSLPYPQWRRDNSLVMEKSWTIDDLLGLVDTISHSSNFEKTSRVIDELKNRLRSVYAESGMGVGQKLVATFPVFMMMGHKPETPMSTAK